MRNGSGIQIETVDGRPLPPINPHYQNQTVEIEAGQRLARSINITPLYPLSEFGTYRVRAAVYVSQLGKYFVSPQLNIEITEGRQLWQQTVGVPEGLGQGRARTFTVLAHRLPRRRCFTCGSRTRRQELSTARRKSDVSSLSQVPISNWTAEIRSTSSRTPLPRHFVFPLRCERQSAQTAGLSGL